MVRYRQQSGYAFLFTFLLMLSILGLYIPTALQEEKASAVRNRLEHNKDVLNQAKYALLMYAYNYPELVLPPYTNITPSFGAGRLPCPDNSNNGLIALADDKAACELVGRFPWAEPALGFYDARDASGERLWYAVSDEFRIIEPEDPVVGEDIVVNSESGAFKNNITIVDQTGDIIYSGDIDGVAAVIIAPGGAISRDEDDDGVYEYIQVRGTVFEITDPRNYLDTFNSFDNSIFNSGESDSDDDGFILGPIRESDPVSAAVNTIVVNDQMVVITTEEVLAMAEKAVLQAYQTEIAEYSRNAGLCTGEAPPGSGVTEAICIANGGAWLEYYPWLDLYNSADGLATYNGEIPALVPVSDPSMGRIPSIFGDYFSGSSSGTIESELNISIFYDGFEWEETDTTADVSFDVNGDLVTDSTHSSGAKVFWVWDGHATTPHALSPQDGIFEECTGTAGTGLGGTGFIEDNCNRKIDGTFKIPTDASPASSDVWLEVKVFSVNSFNIAGGALTFNDANLKAAPLLFTAPTTTEHAFISADYNNNAALLDILSNEFDTDFLNSFDTNPGPAFDGLGTDRIRVRIRYYPELPTWVLENSWHDNIMLAYSAAVQPGGDTTCTPTPVFPFTAATNLNLDYCLALENSGGIKNDKSAILFSAGAQQAVNTDFGTGLTDGGGLPNYYADDLTDIFEGENSTNALPHAPGSFVELEALLKFDKRVNGGNDLMLVIE